VTPERERWLLPLLLVFAAILTLGTAGWGSLYNETDGQYAGAAKVMAQGGSWLVPENNGVPRLVKPPLLYWGMAAAMKVFGINEFAARLPSCLAIIAWVGITFLIGRRMGGPWRGFLAGAILLTCLGSFTLGRIVMPEPLFSALIAASLYCALRTADQPGRKWILGFWLFASLASFSKGWHGLLYPLAIVGLAALFHKESRKNLRGILSWQGVLLFAVINLPWYFYIESRYPGWLHNLIFAEQLGHVAGSSAPATNYSIVPRWQFVLLHLAWFFPWSIALLLSLFTFRRSGKLSFATTLLICWVGVVFGSVMLTGQRQDYYAMSMWPAFALLAAVVVERASLRAALIALTVVLTLAFAGVLAVPHVIAGATADTADRSTAWTTMTQLGPEVWENLSFTGAIGLGLALLFCIAALMCDFLQRAKTARVALVLTATCAAMAAAAGFARVSVEFSLAEAAPKIRTVLPPDGLLVFDGDIDTGSSLLVYTDSPVTLLDQNPNQDFIVTKFGIGRDRYITSHDLAKLWKSGRTVVFVTEASKVPAWEKLLGSPLKEIETCGTQIVLKN
jgi:4-amino-4-deoxy-L-arabinose transferase-like glycosyltransferase